MNEKKLHEIINKLIQVRGESSLKISDECIFIQACTYERGEIANQGKSFVNKLADSIPKPSEKREMATEKQLNYIYRNNLNVDTKDLTKLEATKIIGEHKR